MAFCELKFRSKALGKAVTCNVLLPDNARRSARYPVLYLLHGYSDDYTTWLRRTSLERYVEGTRLAVIMPDGGHEFYSNARTGYAYETFITKELPAVVESYFPVGTVRAKRALGGLSMGGYGALRLGLKYPERYISIHSHSGALDIERMLRDPANTIKHIKRVFGESVAGTDADIFHLAMLIDRRVMPAVRFDCGLKDSLLADNRKLKNLFKRRKCKAEYAEYPGGHNWAYWDEHIQEALRFHLRHLA